jgi:hypothetical protein
MISETLSYGLDATKASYGPSLSASMVTRAAHKTEEEAIHPAAHV